MCGAKEGTVMRAVVVLCTLATSFKERSLAHQDSRPFTNCPVGLIRFYMKVMVPKERNPGNSLSWQVFVLCAQLREFSPAAKGYRMCWSDCFPDMNCSSPGDHQRCYQDIQWIGRKVFSRTRNLSSSLAPLLFLKTQTGSQNSQTYHLLNVFATLPWEHILFLTLCVSFGKYTISKRSQLNRDPRQHRKTTEHTGIPTAQLNKQRKWEHGLENLAQMKELTTFFQESGHFWDPNHNPVWWWLHWEKIFFFLPNITHLVPLELQRQFCHLPAGNKFLVTRAQKHRADWGAQFGFFFT